VALPSGKNQRAFISIPARIKKIIQSTNSSTDYLFQFSLNRFLAKRKSRTFRHGKHPLPSLTGNIRFASPYQNLLFIIKNSRILTCSPLRKWPAVKIYFKCWKFSERSVLQARGQPMLSWKSLMNREKNGVATMSSGNHAAGTCQSGKRSGGIHPIS